MQIQYFGHSCFLISGSKTVLTDPFDGIGFDLPRLTADYVLSSHNHFDHNAFFKVFGKMNVAFKAGAEESSPISLIGIPTFHDDAMGALRGENVVYKFTLDGVTFMHLGDLGEQISAELFIRLGTADVLFLPVGGTYTIDYRQAKRLADGIKAKVVIPMHYKTPRSTVDVDPVDRFLSLCDGYQRADGPIEITKDLLEGENKVILMDCPDC